MKKYKWIVLAAALTSGLTSCKKDFLDLSPQNGDLSDNIIFSSKAGAENALTGIYWIYRSENYRGYGGTPGSTNLTCRGLQTIMFFFEVKGNDLFDAYNTWWRTEGAWEENGNGRIQTGSRTNQIWDVFYKVINNSNAIIKNVPDIKTMTQAEKDQFIAEAKANRAYAYFWLARVYQYTYAKNPDAPGVPIYTEPATNASKGNARSSLKDVYKLILEDLNAAVGALTEDRVGKFRINKNVAQGILAEVYQELAMSDASLWQKAIDNAKAARTGFPLMSNADYAGGFNNVDNPEWIWGLPVPEDQTLTYYSQYSFMDTEGGYYKNIAVNKSFAESYSATDTRKTLMKPVTSSTNPALAYQTRKYRTRVQGSITGDIILMRAAEMLLIEAEGLAQQDKLQEAIDLLFTLQQLRDPSATKMALAPKDAVINAILFERRKELYGELGTYYFDLKRYQRPLVRDGNHPYPLNIPADDARWLFQIPLSEIDANPNINPEHQNP